MNLRKLALKTAFVAMMSGFVVALAPLTPPALAQYPTQPVSFVVPFPPGDAEDILTRMIAEDFQKEYGVAAAVVNKPGEGGNPFEGAVEVANSPADGSVVGSFVIGIPVVGPTLGIADLNPDPFEPLGIFLTYPFIIATSKDAPYQTMEELAAYAKKKDVVLGHFGPPLVPTQVTLALAKKMGFNYASDSAFDSLDCNTLASGDVDVMNTTLPLVLPCLDKITVLATVTGKERISIVPKARTVAEIVPDLNIALWNGLFVHKDTPQDVRDKIIAVAKKTVKSARAQAFGKETGTRVYWQDAGAAKKQIKKDIATTAKIGKLIGE